MKYNKINNLEFNIAGPCLHDRHYMLDPLRGIENDLMSLIDGNKYFIIHAARQSGKTTLLLELAKRINLQGKYYALYSSFESIGQITDPEKAIPLIIRKIKSNIIAQKLPDTFAEDADYDNYTGILKTTLSSYCKSLDKPLIIFFDEADCLSNGTLITFLRQLREGYIERGNIPFVHSIALVGMLNLRDYKVFTRPEYTTIGSQSPFNIISESLNLKNFTKQDVIDLYIQHTKKTGQIFEQKAVEYIFEQTQGQPWLVNAIARECVEKILKKDYSVPITQTLAETAIQDITRDRRTHIDSMMFRLKEPRVCNIIKPILLGEDIKNRSNDDFLYTKDLGLIRENDDGSIEPGNPIYGDMIIRTLNWDIQETIKRKYNNYVIPRYLVNGKIDIDFLLKDFQEFWRENSEIWKSCLEKDFYKYEEAAAHLVIYAFLQRVINGGGIVLREKSSGTGRVDLCILYNEYKYPIEIKLHQNEKSREKSIDQIIGYMDNLGVKTGWLVIFDRDINKSWDEKIYKKEEIINDMCIKIYGC